MGIHLVTWDSAGLEISPDTYSSLSEIRPAAGPLCQALWPPLCESRQPREAGPVRGSLSGRLSTQQHRPREAGLSGVGRLGHTVSAKPPLRGLQNVSVRTARSYS